MSNPTTLQELAANLAASARYTHQRQDAAPSAGDGAYLAGYAAALLDTRATVLAMIAEARCPECGCPLNDHHEACSQRPPKGIHKAESYTIQADGSSFCKHCGEAIKHLPAGQGWVHEDTGMVVGDGPES